ncbi:CBO0543 family protein [Neobacillus sp. D3-1R]|uniref:CBO0543 family protein n=1 Tax=Neobacillus sp. D3-1R TaxID=3445778 RepID=UPI003F9F90DD
MVNAIYAFIWLFILWKWGDWRNWKKYYPTILFFIIGDFIYLYLLSDHYPMWKYNPQGFDENAGITNSHVSLSIMAVKYPATILVYLSKFPEGNHIKQIFYILCWVGFYGINEFIDTKLHLINYYNGWNFGWSLLFNAVAFIILRIHYLRPLLAWCLSVVFILVLWNVFDVPSSVFR